MYITIRKTYDGAYLIEDSNGRFMRYYYYSKREALRKFTETLAGLHRIKQSRPHSRKA